MGPTGVNSDINVSGTASLRRLATTVRATFHCSHHIIIRRNVRTHRVRVTMLKGSSIRASMPNRVIGAGSFCSCRRGCNGRRILLRVPTRLPRRVATGLRRCTAVTFQTLSNDNLDQYSFFIAGGCRVCVGRIGALPNFASHDVCPLL